MKFYFSLLSLFVCLQSVNAKNSEMVLIEAGYFSMGCNDIKEHNISLEHRVYLDSFFIDPYEVTNVEFEKEFPEHKVRRHPTSACDDCPVTKVSWYDAQEYCKKSGKKLPTEAQWEKAAAAHESCAYSWPGALFKDKSEARNSGFVRGGFELDEGTSVVGSYPPNRYGLYDMLGNVWEWTQDWMGAQMSSDDQQNPTGVARGHFKVRRGGAWSDDVRGLMVSWRDWSAPDTTFFVDVGFRCAKPQSPSVVQP